MELLTDRWWLDLWNAYSISIGILIALLKAWAVLHPGAETNKIMELLALAFKKPGA